MKQILWLADLDSHGKLWTQQVILSEGIVLQILHIFEDSLLVPHDLNIHLQVLNQNGAGQKEMLRRNRELQGQKT